MGINPFVHGSAKHTDIMKTEGLKQALNKYGFDAAFGGARRDEEIPRKSASTFRDRFHRWDPKNQRPGLAQLQRQINKGASASSRSPTGPSWISGSTSIWKILKSCRCIWPLSVRCWSATVC